MQYDKHALILGASGISGWALLNQAREYPSATTFSRITATTNRPLSLKEALIEPDERINLVNGIDFTKSVGEVEQLLKDKIKDVDTVTHVFFTVYIAKPSFQELRKINDQLLSTAISAISSLCPKLEVVILQTGGKAYGVEFTDKVSINPPLSESLPRIPEPESENIFYYSQYDILSKLAQGKSWSFNEVRPDVIVGWVPVSNAMDCARGVALYLSLWKLVHGGGSTVPFPGTEKSWKARHTDTSQDILARFEIFAALKPETCGKGEIFNIADAASPVSWEHKWPGLCEYFGLVGVGPEGNQKKTIDEFVKEHQTKWESTVHELGMRINAMKSYQWDFLSAVMVGCDFDRYYDLSKAKGIGFTEEVDTVSRFHRAFDRLREAKIIPPS